MLNNFIFSISSAIPIFLVMLLGYFLRHKKLINDDFAKNTNAIVFNIALPVKLFSDVYKTSLDEFFDLKFVVFIITGTILSVTLIWLIGSLFIKEKIKLGAFVHGAYRGNFLYIGLSLMENITGSIGLKAPLVIAFTVPLYNVLAVIILTYTNTRNGSAINIKNTLASIAKNPLILAILLGAAASQLGIKMPVFAARTMGYLENIATPLALLIIGSSFNMKKINENMFLSLMASLFKLVITPLIAVAAAVSLGFSSEDVILIYVLFGVPTATVSYIMTSAMNGDKDLSSSIIMTTTILSNISMTLFIFAFKTMGFV